MNAEPGSFPGCPLEAADPSGRIAGRIEAHPASVLREPLETTSPRRPIRDRLLSDRARAHETGLVVGRFALVGPMLADKHAFCVSAPSCLLFRMMLFDTHPSASGGLGRSIVVRPAHLDGNPLWPYLNDLEFWFFLAAIVGSGAAAWMQRERGGPAP